VKLVHPQALADLLSRYRYDCASEFELQNGIEEVLKDSSFDYEREVRLSKEDRVDFLVDRIGIEIKIDGSTTELLRQLARYAKHEKIKCLVVVTSRSRLTSLPERLGGKPILTVNVSNPF